MSNTPTTEQQTAGAILQKPDTLTVAGRTFICPKPTLGDLIELSATVSDIPQVNTDTDNALIETLRIAKDAAPLARAVAILIRGTRGTRSPFLPKRLLARLRLKHTARFLTEHATNAELRQAAIQRLAQTQAGDFFGLTAFLSAANLTKATTETGPHSD